MIRMPTASCSTDCPSRSHARRASGQGRSRAAGEKSTGIRLTCRATLLRMGLALLVTASCGCRPQEPAAFPPLVAGNAVASDTPALGPVPAQDTGPPVTAVTYAGKRFTVCQVDLTRHKLELFWRDERKQPFRTFAALDQWLAGRGRRLIFATNAGMFRPDLSPVGLYVEHGQELCPLNLRRGTSNFCLHPNGVFCLTRTGAAVVVSSEYARLRPTVVAATQSGPMLVIKGRLHPSFRASSQSRLIRNGVGVISPQRVVFAIAEDPVNFHEFATFFRDGLGCANALYLDGSVSSIYSTVLNRNDCHAELGPMLAVTEAQ